VRTCDTFKVADDTQLQICDGTLTLETCRSLTNEADSSPERIFEVDKQKALELLAWLKERYRRKEE